LNLDEFNAADWGEDALKALDKWQQGDIVETGKTLIWAGPGGTDVITGLDGAHPDQDRTLFAPRQDTGTGLAVITSQTCDVIGTGPGAKQPWVQVSPICQITNTSAIAEIQDRKRLNHFLVTGLDSEGCHAVDLRLSMPISKAILIDQEPRRGFDESLAPLFAEQLATKAGRVSFHDLLSFSLARALAALVEQEKNAGTWPGYVEQFRIGVKQGTPLRPLSFYLLAVTEVVATGDFEKKVRGCFSTWKKSERANLRVANIVPDDPKVRALEDLTIPTYRDTFHLAVPGFTTHFWF